MDSFFANVMIPINTVNHIAFILDGNRRFANKNGISIKEGHKLGLSNTLKLIKFCISMQIKEITLFVFSIHNFKRSDSEVQYLMNMVEKHIDEYNSKKSSNLKESQVRYRVIGQKALFPEKLKRVLGKYDSESRLGDKIVNIAMCYCSDEESSYASLVMKNDFCSSLVTRKFGKTLKINTSGDKRDLISRMWTSEISPPDLLVRTSGENRLSDFLLWNINEKTRVVFVDKMWPELSWVDIVWAILRFCIFR